MVIKCYEGGREINIDVSVINPMADSYVQLASEPLGAAYHHDIGNNWFEPMAVESFGDNDDNGSSHCATRFFGLRRSLS